MDQVVKRERLVSAAEFREAMTRHAASVCIVTTDGPAGPAGFTATSVTSISDDPPTLLVCQYGDASSARAFRDNGVYCVNVLSAEQERLAADFAGRGGLTMEGRMGRGSWSTLETGAPVLEGALAAFDCRIVEIVEIATHAILIGEVAATGVRPDEEALIYTGRAFRRL